MVASFAQPVGEGWAQIGQLALAFGLSALIGLERELRQRSAGLRTHALVGVASALFMLVSKYGFSDVLSDHVMLDPSRVAAQIVSGIGFIGAGLIFVRRDAVRGLTTAATIWLTAAVGMAAGAGLPLLACLVTLAHFIVVYGFTPIVRELDGLTANTRTSLLRITYRDGQGILRTVLSECTGHGLTIAELSAEQDHPKHHTPNGAVAVTLRVTGTADVNDVAATLLEIPGVLAVTTTDDPSEED